MQSVLYAISFTIYNEPKSKVINPTAYELTETQKGKLTC